MQVTRQLIAAVRSSLEFRQRITGVSPVPMARK